MNCFINRGFQVGKGQGLYPQLYFKEKLFQHRKKVEWPAQATVSFPEWKLFRHRLEKLLGRISRVGLRILKSPPHSKLLQGSNLRILKHVF